jgi:hypothetical protein
MKALVLITVFSLTALFAQAETVTCTPPKNSNWQNAEISELENGTQGYLLHVKAWGHFRAMDLICNSTGSKCLGFINGVETKGKIGYSSTVPIKIVSLTIEDLWPNIKSSNEITFQCE